MENPDYGNETGTNAPAVPSNGPTFGGLLGKGFDILLDYGKERATQNARKQEIKNNDRDLQNIANAPVSNKTLVYVGVGGAVLLVAIIIILRNK